MCLKFLDVKQCFFECNGCGHLLGVMRESKNDGVVLVMGVTLIHGGIEGKCPVCKTEFRWKKPLKTFDEILNRQRIMLRQHHPSIKSLTIM